VKPLNMAYLYASALYNSKKYDDAIKIYGLYLNDDKQQIQDGNYKFVIGSVFGTVLCYFDKNDKVNANKYIEIGLKMANENDDQESKIEPLPAKAGRIQVVGPIRRASAYKAYAACIRHQL